MGVLEKVFKTWYKVQQLDSWHSSVQSGYFIQQLNS